MVTLYNVVDIRNNQFHSIAIVKERNAKWYVPVEAEESPAHSVKEGVDESS